jgi:hypothetical protein
MNTIMYNNIYEGHKYYKYICWLLIAITTISFFLYCLGGKQIYLYNGLIFLAIQIICIKDNELFYSIFYYLPSIRMYRFYEGGNTVLGIIFILMLLKFIYFRRFKLNIYYPVVALFLYLLGSLACFIVTDSYELLLPMTRILTCILLFFYIISKNKNNLTYVLYKTINYFICGCVVTTLLGIVFNLLKGINLLGSRFSGIGEDPNYYSLSYAFALSVLAVNAYAGKKDNTNNLLLMFIVLICGALSLSRAYVFCVSINVVLLLPIYMRTNKIKLAFVVTVIMLFLTFSHEAFTKNFYYSFLERFVNDDFEGGNGRYSIWSYYIGQNLKDFQSFIFGIGTYANNGMLSIGAVQHNTVLEIFSTIGGLGLFITICCYYSIFNNIKKIVGLQSFKVIFLFPFITIFIGYLSVNGMYSDSQVLLFCLSILFGSLLNKQYNESHTL